MNIYLPRLSNLTVKSCWKTNQNFFWYVDLYLLYSCCVISNCKRRLHIMYGFSSDLSFSRFIRHRGTSTRSKKCSQTQLPVLDWPTPRYIYMQLTFSTHIHMHMHIHTYTCTCIYTHTHAHTHPQTHNIYMYIYTHTHTHIHVYLYTHTHFPLGIYMYLLL